MKKVLFVMLFVFNSFALTCSNSEYQITIDENLKVELVTPSEVVVSDKAMSNNSSYYFGNFSVGSIRSFTLDVNRGELKLIGNRIIKQQVKCL